MSNPSKWKLQICRVCKIRSVWDKHEYGDVHCYRREVVKSRQNMLCRKISHTVQKTRTWDTIFNKASYRSSRTWYQTMINLPKSPSQAQTFASASTTNRLVSADLCKIWEGGKKVWNPTISHYRKMVIQQQMSLPFDIKLNHGRARTWIVKGVNHWVELMVSKTMQVHYCRTAYRAQNRRLCRLRKCLCFLSFEYEFWQPSENFKTKELL